MAIFYLRIKDWLNCSLLTGNQLYLKYFRRSVIAIVEIYEKGNQVFLIVFFNSTSEIIFQKR